MGKGLDMQVEHDIHLPDLGEFTCNLTFAAAKVDQPAGFGRSCLRSFFRKGFPFFKKSSLLLGKQGMCCLESLCHQVELAVFDVLASIDDLREHGCLLLALFPLGCYLESPNLGGKFCLMGTRDGIGARCL